MKIISTNFIEPFVMSVCPLFYYEFEEWLEKGSKSERRTKTAVAVLVFGTAIVADEYGGYRYNGTVCLAEGRFYCIPFVNLVDSNRTKYE